VQGNFRQNAKADLIIALRLHRRLLTAIGYLVYAFFVCAVGATVKDAIGLYSMADDFTATVGTLRGHGLNCTFEAYQKHVIRPLQ
jgi:hypothetical protein